MTAIIATVVISGLVAVWLVAFWVELWLDTKRRAKHGKLDGCGYGPANLAKRNRNWLGLEER